MNRDQTGPEETNHTGLVSSGLNRVSERLTSRTTNPIHTSQANPGSSTRVAAVAGNRLHQCLRHRAPRAASATRGLLTHFRGQVLLRKEVIQPHLPVRLPCYDFVPIASPTFDGSLPYGLGHRLRVLPTFVT